MNVGELIRNKRIERSMTQEELAEKVGVQKSAVAKWENGRVSEIKRSNLKNLADALGLNPNQLLGESRVNEEINKTEELADIIKRMGDDRQFCEVVKRINKLTPEQLSGVEGMLRSLFQ